VRLRRTHFEPDDSQEISGFVGASPSRGSTSTIQSEYAAQLPDLRAGLVEAQLAIRQAGVPVVVLIAGMDGAGKGSVVHRLNEWLDPRGIDTHTFWNASGEEMERPYYWRFWRTLPARGASASITEAGMPMCSSGALNAASTPTGWNTNSPESRPSNGCWPTTAP
jgi:polyphosphate kinase 2 (PPK2 family)